MPDAVARQLGIQDQRNHASTGNEYHAVERFNRQCARAFNALAAEGVLRKASKDTMSPSGQLAGQ